MTEMTKPKPLAHSPEGAAQVLTISTRGVYSLIASGELRSFKIGKRRLIPASELQSLVERKMAQAANA